MAVSKFSPLAWQQTSTFILKPSLFLLSVPVSHLNNRHRNKAAVSEAEVCPPVRAAHLASLSAFQFPGTVVVFPFWCLCQCMIATCSGAHTASSNSRNSCLYFKTEWGTQTLSFCPKVSLSASATKTAVATWVHRQNSQPWGTASSCFDK
jgi:hypothetical protein